MIRKARAVVPIVAVGVTFATQVALCNDLVFGDGFETADTWMWGEICVDSSNFVFELWWDTPADPDQHDQGPGAGADLDIHFQRDGGPWFDLVADCFWNNRNPDWGIPGYAGDNPNLALDDVDGLGPEFTVIDELENGVVYRIGAHLFNHHGFGESFATIRMCHQGTLAFAMYRRSLSVDNEFWEAWDLEDVAGQIVITPVDIVHSSPP